MDFLKHLFNSPAPKSRKNYFTFNVKCHRCGEIIEGRVDLDNDLSQNDDGNGYYGRKLLMGSNLRFQQIEVELNFDSGRQLIEKNISSGTFIE